jgi:Fe-S-cluster-containing dehydrogenase component
MSISRRGFLAGAALGALTAKTAHASGAKHFEGYPGRYGLLHDTTLCVGCRSCEKACNEVNDLPEPQTPFDDKAVFEQKRHITDSEFTVVNRYLEAAADSPAVFRKHQCMHCNEPCCASVCFVKAFTKTPEGPVLYNPDICVGCRYCMMACPYYATGYEYQEAFTPRVRRCTMCYPRIIEGKNPGCADGCPTGAITFGKRDELIKVARERIAKFPDRYIDHIFGEYEFGGTSWMTLAGVSFNKLGLPEHTSLTPLPEIGTSYLTVVPLIVSIYPGLLAGFYAFSKRKDKLTREKVIAAVTEAVAKADEETKAKLEAAAAKAGKDKEKAIAQAVKKALAEAEAKAKAEAEGGDKEDAK